MICYVCNRQVASKDTHIIYIKNGVNYSDYIHNHFILCPTCYSNFKYILEVFGTSIEGPEDTNLIEYPGKTVIHDTEWDSTHPAPGYENA